MNEAGKVCYVRDVPESASKPPPVQQIARALRPGLRKLQTAVPFPGHCECCKWLEWSKKNDKQLGAREVCEIVDIIYIYIRIYIESRLTVSYCFVLFHDVLFSWHDLHQILQNMCRMHLMIGCYMSSIWFCLYHREWASVGCHAKSILKAHAWLWMYVSILCKWVRTHSPATVYEHEF